METELKELKNTEGQEVCICKDCKKQFTPHEVDVDCAQCDDGDYLYEREDYEGGSFYGKCRACNGHGSYTYKEKQRCKPCYEDYQYREDENYY